MATELMTAANNNSNKKNEQNIIEPFLMTIVGLIQRRTRQSNKNIRQKKKKKNLKTEMTVKLSRPNRYDVNLFSVVAVVTYFSFLK